MKKKLLSAISIVVALSVILSGFSAVGASAADDFGRTMTKVGVSALEGIICGVIGGLNLIVPDSSSFKKISEYSDENFYSGNKELLDKPAAGAKWQFGYAKASLVPDDVLDKDGEYYLGGFMTLDNGMNNKIEEIVDDMQIICGGIIGGPYSLKEGYLSLPHSSKEGYLFNGWFNEKLLLL